MATREIEAHTRRAVASCAVNRRLRIATRGSEQARAQASAVADRLRASGYDAELVLIETEGDLVRDRPIWEIGGRGVFVKEVQRAVLENRADIAVHSAKDLPSSFDADGLMLAGVPERGDPRDALVGSTLAGLARGAVVATGSQRRESQLARLRPDLSFVSLRGNIPSRVRRADEADVDAVVVAVAGVRWVGLEHRLAQTFEADEMIPQVGQGALALECRADDRATASAIGLLDHAPSRRCVEAERAFLRQLGGGCELPVGAHATIDGGQITISGLISSRDGQTAHRDQIVGHDADVGGRLARLLLSRGAHQLL